MTHDDSQVEIDVRTDLVREASNVEMPVGGVLAKHPALATVWRMRNLALALLPALPSAVLGSAFLPGFLGLAPAGLLVLALMTFGWWHAGAAFKRYRVQVLDDGVMVERGVFWHAQTFIPQSRIQHTEVNQGPLDRRWGMAKLIVHTAAAGVASIAAVGLHHADAIAVRDQLLDRGHDAV
jgi:membrane protein YdbS with pleckstrin-like domain